MLSVPKSSSKDKKASKEQKTPIKSTVLNGGNGIPASAYNPLLGTFHTLDTSSTASAQIVHGNGRFRNIDETENHNGSAHGSGGDYDSASNNDTRSVESEDQNKEKSNAPNKQEVIPGADNDKREKVRQKNEKKHQRQKEKRAQELHERCNGYLMSRKLESLAQQLVVMGFSHERSTMALILNEGRVEQAVSWLFEGGEESDAQKDQNLNTGNNLKIDISEEIARISEMEIKFKCSRQDVERAIVSCEGDLEKSEEVLTSQKHDQPEAPPKPEEIGDPPIISNGKIYIASSPRIVKLLQPKPNSVSSILQRKDDKDFNYTKTPVTVGLTPKSMPKPVQPVTRPQQIATPTDRSWPIGGSIPSVSYSLAPSVQVSPPPSKVDSRYAAIGNEYKNLQPGSVREPVVMMQRPQSINTKTVPVNGISSSPPGVAGKWYPSSSEVMKSNGFLPHIPSTRSPSPNDLTTANQFYHPAQYQQQHQSFMLGSTPMDNNPMSSRVNGSFPRMGSSPTQAFTLMDNSFSNRVNDSFSRMGSNPMDNSMSSRVNDPFPRMAAASSLGLFPGVVGSAGSSGSTSPVDWNTSNSMPSCDYTSIDWSLDRSFLPSNPNSLWLGLGPYSRSNEHVYNSGVNIPSRSYSSNGNGVGVPIMGLQDGGAATPDPSANNNSREWTSPFEGKDLFSLPRQFVFSPSLL